MQQNRACRTALCRFGLGNRVAALQALICCLIATLKCKQSNLMMERPAPQGCKVCSQLNSAASRPEFSVPCLLLLMIVQALDTAHSPT